MIIDESVRLAISVDTLIAGISLLLFGIPMLIAYYGIGAAHYVVSEVKFRLS